MFFNAEDDDQDFMPAGGGGGGKKLASLFGMDKASNQGGNESLTYTAPKQPKKKEPSPEGGAAPAVLSASVVHAYKYVENQYASQGKLGMAILANHTTKDYRILLYRNKQQQITNAKLSPSFSFNIQANNYASFYDEGRQSWSVMFDKEESIVKFAKDVAVCCANSVGGGLESVVMQDLGVGEGGELQVEDSAEIRYTGWLLTQHTFGQVFDSNAKSDKLFRFKLGKGKVIKGWEAGIIGMKKGGRRLLVVPPSFGYGSQGMGDKIPVNSTLIFDVEVVRVKLQKGDSPSPSPAPTAEPAAAEEDHSSESIKIRSQSITEHIAQSPKSDKAKLISRMAKMGQPMLPLVGAVPAQAEEEGMAADEAASPVPVADANSPQPIAQNRPVLPGKPASQPIIQPTPNMAQPITQPVMQQGMMGQGMMGQQLQGQPAFVQNLPGAQQLAVFQPNNILQQQQQAAMAMQQQQNMSAFQPPGYQYQQQPQQPLQQPYQGLMFAGAQPSPAPPPSNPGQVDALAPVLLTESRQQNTEVRLSISKMGDKIDRILEKMNTVGGGGLSMHAPSMETGILLQNITRIVQENETLKQDVYEKSAKIESQNEKIAGLLQKNQKYVEQSNTLLEERNEGYKHSASQSQARVLALEQEKVNLATEMSTASAQLSSLQLELATSRKKEADLRQTLQTSTDTGAGTKDELDRLKMQRIEDEKRITDLSTSLREEKVYRKNIEGEKSNLQEEFDDMKSAYNSMEKNLNERKRKANEERRRLEEEMEDMKINLEGEIQSLRDKLRRQKTNTDVVTADKAARLEEDIGAEWQQKCDKLLKAAADKHNRALQDVKEEKFELQTKIQELENKLQSLKTSSGSTGQRIAQLEEEVEELSLWKEKYENLRGQATSMKERYEERLGDLEEEKEQVEERVQLLQTQVAKLRSQVTAGSGDGATAAPVSGDVVSEVKKIMNNVYRGLREEFETDESYTGSEVLNSILSAIKTTTLQLVQRQQSEGGKTEEEEEEDDEDEDEQNEEESKEEEKQADPVDEKVTEADVNKSETTVPPPTPEAPVVETETPVTASVTEDAPQAEAAHTKEQVVETVTPVTASVSESAPQAEAAHTEEAQEDSPADPKDPQKDSPEDSDSPSDSEEPSGNPEETQSDPESSEDFSTEDMPRSGKKRKGSAQSKMTRSSAQPTGDKGNQYHTHELDMARGIKPQTATLTSQGKPVQPKMTMATNQPTGDKGNPYHSKELDKAGAVEPLMASSSNQSLHAAPKSSKDHAKPVQPKMTMATNQPTGDKGNPYHSKELDKAGAVEPLMASSSNQSLHAAPKSSKDHAKPVQPKMTMATNQPTGDKGNPYHSKELDKAGAVEPLMASSSNQSLHAAPKSSKDHAKPVQPKMTMATNQPTGDKGNPYHSKELDKAGAVEPSMASSSNQSLHAAPKSSKDHAKPVQPKMTMATNQPTGDKGNPYHSKELDKAGAVEPLMASSSNQSLHAAPKSSKDHAKSVQPKMTMATNQPTGDKGNPYHSKELDKAGAVEPLMASSSNQSLHAAPKSSKDHAKPVQPKMTMTTNQPTGDKGNPYHSKELDKAGAVEPLMASSSNQSLHAAPKSSKDHAKPVQPKMTMATNQPTGDKGNPYHSKELDKAGAVEPLMASSSNQSLHAAPKSSKDHAKPVQPKMTMATNQPTGDKGNPYHSKELDKAGAVEPLMASSSNQSLHAAPKSSKDHAKPVQPKMTMTTNQPTGDKGNPYHSKELDKAGAVEPLMASSSNQSLHAAPKSSKDHAKPVQPKMTMATNQPTGDKGNPYHSKELDKAGAVEPLMASSSNQSLHAAPKSSKDHAKPVQPKMTMTTNQPTGDKGNPYHSKELDKAGAVEPLMASSSNPSLKSEPPSKTNLVDPKSSNSDSKSHNKPIIQPMMSCNVSQALGDKGNPHHRAELDKLGNNAKNSHSKLGDSQTSDSKQSKSSDSTLKSTTFDPLASRAKIEPMMSSSVGQALGDKGNPYHKKSLDSLPKKEASKQSSAQPASSPSDGKDSPDKSTNQSEASKVSSDLSSSNVTPSQSAESLQSDLSKSSSNSANNNQSDSKDSKPANDNQGTKERTNSTSSTGKQSRSGSALSEGLPTLASREPPPLFEDDDDKDNDSPLFGKDDTVADTLGTTTAPGDSDKKNEKKSSKLPSKTDLIDDGDAKAPPPPLFGDDDDDDDLDWLSG